MKHLYAILRAITTNHSLSLSAALLLMLVGSLSLARVHAQSASPIEIGGTELGEITADEPLPNYRFSSATTQSIMIEVRAVSQDFYPQFTIFTANDALLSGIGNPYQESSVRTRLDVQAGAEYRIQISSANGLLGTFALSLSVAGEIAAPSELSPNNPELGELASGDSLRWVFRTEVDQSYSLLLEGPQGGQGLSLELSDTNGRIIAFLGSDVLSSSLKLAPGLNDYAVTLRNDLLESPPLAYSLSLVSETSTSASADEPVTQARLSSQGACVLATARPYAVNLRAGAGENFDIVGAIFPNLIYPVVGRDAGRNWYQIEAGWVSAAVTRLGGDCSGVGVSDGGSSPQPTLIPPGSNY